MFPQREKSDWHILAYLCIGILWAGLALAQNDPGAEQGDALFKAGSDVGISWPGVVIPIGHAAIYYGYYARTWDGQFRHTVIQANGYGLDVRPFDYTADSPTFMGSDSFANYTAAGLGARNCCSHGTWDGSANTMTLARRSAIITESLRLLGVGVPYPSFSLPDVINLWEPTSLNPRSTPIGTPKAMRCDGLVEWVYEKVGFNTCNNANTFSYYYWYLDAILPRSRLGGRIR